MGSIRKINNKNPKEELKPEEKSYKVLDLKSISDQYITIHHDGKISVHAEYSWDSSLHDCIFLNRETEKDTSLLMNLEFEIGFEGQEVPSEIVINVKNNGKNVVKKNKIYGSNNNNIINISNACPISMDVSLLVQNRLESSIPLLNIFNKQNILSDQYTMIYNIVVEKISKKKNYLFTCNEENKYIRGEECLGKLEFLNYEDLIVESIKTLKNRRKVELVEYTKQFLYLREKEQELKKRIKNNTMEEKNKNKFINGLKNKDDKWVRSSVYIWKSRTLYDNKIIVSLYIYIYFNNFINFEKLELE